MPEPKSLLRQGNHFLYIKGDFDKALEVYTQIIPKNQEDYGKAQFEIFRIYLDQFIKGKSLITRAQNALLASVSAGNYDATLTIAEFHTNGQYGFAKDYAAAYKYFSRIQNYDKKLGDKLFYLSKQILAEPEVDYPLAIKTLELACRQGHPDALANLHKIYKEVPTFKDSAETIIKKLIVEGRAPRTLEDRDYRVGLYQATCSSSSLEAIRHHCPHIHLLIRSPVRHSILSAAYK